MYLWKLSPRVGHANPSFSMKPPPCQPSRLGSWEAWVLAPLCNCVTPANGTVSIWASVSSYKNKGSKKMIFPCPFNTSIWQVYAKATTLSLWRLYFFLSPKNFILFITFASAHVKWEYVVTIMKERLFQTFTRGASKLCLLASTLELDYC